MKEGGETWEFVVVKDMAFLPVFQLLRLSSFPIQQIRFDN